MTNEEFDHITGEKLQNYSAAIPAGLWEKIHASLNEPSSAILDQHFKTKLQDYSAPYSADLWNRIMPEEEKKRRIFFLLPKRTMVAASLMMLILASSVSAFLYYRSIQTDKNVSETTLFQSDNNNPQKDKQEQAITLLKDSTADAIDQDLAIENTDQQQQQYPLKHNKISAVSDLASISAKENTADEPSDQESLTEENYEPFAKLDASVITNKLKFNHSEKQISFQRNAGNIKNVMICPSDKKLRNPDWDLEIFASPDYALKSTGNITASQQFMSRKDSSERSQLSYSAGFRIVKPINDHFSVKTGLQYSQINERFTYQTENELKTTTVITVRNITLANGSTVTVTDTSVLQQLGYKTNTVKNRYKSIDIPFLLGYQLGNDDFKIGINAGLIFNLSSWYTGMTLDSTLNTIPLNKSSNLVYKNNTGVGLYAGLSLTKRVNFNTSIFAEPYLRYNLSDMTTPGSVYKQRFSIGGLSLGLRFNLNNR